MPRCETKLTKFLSNHSVHYLNGWSAPSSQALHDATREQYTSQPNPIAKCILFLTKYLCCMTTSSSTGVMQHACRFISLLCCLLRRRSLLNTSMWASSWFSDLHCGMLLPSYQRPVRACHKAAAHPRANSGMTCHPPRGDFHRAMFIPRSLPFSSPDCRAHLSKVYTPECARPFFAVLRLNKLFLFCR